jgi:hypothetical protein
MSIEEPNSPESPYPRYEDLPENQEEVLASQFGIEDAEALEFAFSCEAVDREEWTAEEIISLLEKALEQEK